MSATPVGEGVRLRTALYRIGRTTRRLRLALGATLFVVIVWIGIVGHTPLRRPARPWWPLDPPVIADLPSICFWAAATATVAAFIIAYFYRELQRDWICEQLSRLPANSIRSILLPMGGQGGDTRTLVTQLAGEFGIRDGEVIPADAPAGRGDEASAAE